MSKQKLRAILWAAALCVLLCGCHEETPSATVHITTDCVVVESENYELIKTNDGYDVVIDHVVKTNWFD